MVTGNGIIPLLLWEGHSSLFQLAVRAQLVWLLLPLQHVAVNFLFVSLGPKRCFPPFSSL